MLEAGGHVGDRLAGVEQQRGLEVAEVVQAGLDAKLSAQPVPGVPSRGDRRSSYPHEGGGDVVRRLGHRHSLPLRLTPA